MRTWIVTMLLFLPLLVIGQEKKQPELKFDTLIYDFGRVKELGGNVKHIFTYTNTTKRPLIIKNVRASCGCTTPEWSKKPILPGKSGAITVTFDPERRPGNFNKEIIVNNTSNKPSIVLVVKGIVERAPVMKK